MRSETIKNFSDGALAESIIIATSDIKRYEDLLSRLVEQEEAVARCLSNARTIYWEMMTEKEGREWKGEQTRDS